MLSVGKILSIKHQVKTSEKKFSAFSFSLLFKLLFKRNVECAVDGKVEEPSREKQLSGVFCKIAVMIQL